MFGQPVALVAPALGVARQIKRVAIGLRSAAALRNGREIKYRVWNYAAHPSASISAGQ